ncbi:carbohydrate deacetylase isoform X4 [Piliocolobus tephrosceles]|uniref:carbohydrate deacetylase isoform X4 n=1 Tax=Piliocolobus tephrosceles TaxID=591936 RepID=UPI000C29F05B|nr:carbohydrate deacetylase isoform X4 [Piliocolobus tephrosceles]
MSRPRVRLVVTADDFGYCPRRDEGIVEAFLAGAVTSVSLLVNGAATESAAELARRSGPPWRLVAARPRRLLPWQDGIPGGGGGRRRGFASGAEPQLQEDAREDPQSSARRVREELEAQLSCFRELLGRAPTHVDGHQHVHVLPDPLRPQACARCSRRRCRPMGCALRDCRWSAVWVAALGWRPPRAPSPAPWSATPGPPWAPSPATACGEASRPVSYHSCPSPSALTIHLASCVRFSAQKRVWRRPLPPPQFPPPAPCPYPTPPHPTPPLAMARPRG